ncbi:CsbD family protein, partial [Streptococcus danieliae]|nr:CsbD family protein [Streptococcus danieliae]
MSEEKLSAKLDQVTGGLKEAAGKVIGDKKTEAEGLV